MRKVKSGSYKVAENARRRQPNRPHFIPQWAEKSGYKDQAALVEALGADKSVISRWYGGASPGIAWQLKLCALFGYPNRPDIIFQHPDSIWLINFLDGRNEEEIDRAKRTLEAAFPPVPRT